jgi:glycopeptide antibiotics resistance protein
LRKPLALLALTSYLIILITASLWPKPVDGIGVIATITRALLRFTSGIDVLKWIQYNQLEAIANVALYIPLGIFLVLFWPTAKLWLLCLIPVLVSVVVEISQRLFLPDRYSTVNDVFFNALGGLLGVVIAVSIRQRMKNSK